MLLVERLLLADTATLDEHARGRRGILVFLASHAEPVLDDVLYDHMRGTLGYEKHQGRTDLAWLRGQDLVAREWTGQYREGVPGRWKQWAYTVPQWVRLELRIDPSENRHG